MKKFSKTLVLDSSLMPRSVISTERAFVIAYKGNAEILNVYPEFFGVVNPELKISKPSIIKVFKYVNQKYKKVPLNRENVFKRDNHQCVYCGEGLRRVLTIDHVIPKSKGGPDSWENWVTACRNCNLEKADLSLEEYGKEIPLPKRPHYLMLMKQLDFIPEEWKYYLFF